MMGSIIYCKKVEDFLPSIKSNIVDLVIADPPFNKGKDYDGYDDNMKEKDYLNWVDNWIKHGFRILKDSGSFWIYCPTSLLGDFQIIGKKYGLWQNTICWKYANPAPDSKRFPKTWSAWLFFSKTEKFKFFPEFCKSIESITPHRKYSGQPFYDMWDDIPKLVGGYLAQSEVVLKPRTKERVFVYQLPIPLLKRIIALCTEKGDFVVDMFAHSGTGAIATELLKRKWIAIEQSKVYCDKIQKRIDRVKTSLILY
ncbi:MAG TPA: site-specific DNA-methyltransferase [bacterium]|nr:site-specific DNA-methyltransferase [bacterium]